MSRSLLRLRSSRRSHESRFRSRQAMPRRSLWSRRQRSWCRPSSARREREARCPLPSLGLVAVQRRPRREVARIAMLGMSRAAALASPAFVGDPLHPFADQAREAFAALRSRFNAEPKPAYRWRARIRARLRRRRLRRLRRPRRSGDAVAEQAMRRRRMTSSGGGHASESAGGRLRLGVCGHRSACAPEPPVDVEWFSSRRRGTRGPSESGVGHSDHDIPQIREGARQTRRTDKACGIDTAHRVRHKSRARVRLRRTRAVRARRLLRKNRVTTLRCRAYRRRVRATSTRAARRATGFHHTGACCHCDAFGCSHHPHYASIRPRRNANRTARGSVRSNQRAARLPQCRTSRPTAIKRIDRRDEYLPPNRSAHDVATPRTRVARKRQPAPARRLAGDRAECSQSVRPRESESGAGRGTKHEGFAIRRRSRARARSPRSSCGDRA